MGDRPSIRVARIGNNFSTWLLRRLANELLGEVGRRCGTSRLGFPVFSGHSKFTASVGSMLSIMSSQTMLPIVTLLLLASLPGATR